MSTSAPSDLREWAEGCLGKVIAGKYELAEIVGVGGTGGVFLGRHRMLEDRSFAVKLIIPDPDAGSLDEQEKRFAREAATALTFAHPRAVQVLEFGLDRENSVMYMAMDYVQGASLSEVVERASQQTEPGEPVIELERALNITLMILDVLEAAHGAGVIHRDIKPSNIMLVREDGEEDVRILDFGLAKLREATGLQRSGEQEQPSPGIPGDVPREQQGSSGAVVGTPQYMAPEQARGAEVDHRADLYSTGVVLYEMLTGALPHEGSSLDALVSARATEPPIPVERARPDLALPRSVEVILDLALAKEPENRFADAARFSQAVEEALDGLEGRAIAESARLIGEPVRDVSAPAPLPKEAPAQANSELPPGRIGGFRMKGPGWLLVGVGAAALAAAVVPTAFVIWNSVQFSRAMGSGRRAMAAEEYQSALADFERALMFKQADEEAAEMMERARRQIAVAEVRRTAERGDVGELRASIQAARRAGAGEELEGLEAVLSAAEQLDQVGGLLDGASFTRAQQILEGLPAELPGPWAAKRKSYSAVVARRLEEARRLLEEGRRFSGEQDVERLRFAVDRLDAFVKRFPHHPSVPHAKFLTDQLLSKIRALEALAAQEVAKAEEDVAAEEAARKARRLAAARAAEEARAKKPEQEALGRLRGLRESGAPLSERIEAASAFLDLYPRSAHAAQVSAWLVEDRRLLRKKAFDRLKSRRVDTESEAKAGMEAARSFLRDHPNSEFAAEVSALVEKWKAVVRVIAEEREVRGEVLDLLNRDEVSVEKRVRSVQRYVDRFWNAGDTGRAREILRTHLLRPVAHEGRLLLASSAARLRAALLFGVPVDLGVYSLNSGKRLWTADIAGEDVVSISLGPGGREMFAGTRSGRLLCWRLSAAGRASAGRGLTPLIAGRFESPRGVVIALGEGRVVTAGARRDALLLTLGEEARPASTEPLRTRGRPLCGCRSADGRRLALGDQLGDVAVFGVAEGGRPKPLWRTRLGGPVESVALSPDGSLLAASWAGGPKSGTRMWSVAEGKGEVLGNHPRGSPWLQVLDEDGRLLIGGVVVGPGPTAPAIPLRIGAACTVEPSGDYLVGATASGEAMICYLPGLLRQIGRMQRDEGAR